MDVIFALLIAISVYLTKDKRHFVEKIGGYAGSILYVDLTDRTVTRKPLSKSMILGFVGGAGINARLAYELIKPGQDPLSPQNILIFGAGPFVGTVIPGAGKCNIAGRSPSTGFFGCTGSGQFGMLKFTGHDHLVISGKADKPVYLKIHDDEVEFRDAGHIWGKDTWETTDAIWGELGDEYMVACIGPAGENLVRDAGIFGNKYSAFARTGLGAVMGSKNLKAVTVYGTKGIGVANPKGFTELIEQLHSKLMARPWVAEFRKYGTLVMLKRFFTSGVVPYKNFVEAANPESYKRFDLKVFVEKMKGGDISCMACPIGCKHFVHLKEGKHAGLAMGISCVLNPIMAIGICCGLDDWPEIIKCHEICNRLGLDSMSGGTLVAYAIELYQKGVIDKQDTGGMELNWGEAETIEGLLRQIAYRETFGRVLADGLIGASRRIGKNSGDYAIHIKGIAPVHDPRANLKPDLFSQLINSRGAHPTPMSPVLFDDLEKYCEKIGVPQTVANAITKDQQANMPTLMKWAEDYEDAMESLGLCKFPIYQQVGIDVWAKLYVALTGIEITGDALLMAAARACDVKRAFNLREGASMKDDTPPRRFMTEPLVVGGELRPPLEGGLVNRLITQYYRERGWDPSEGTVRDERVRELGLDAKTE